MVRSEQGSEREVDEEACPYYRQQEWQRRKPGHTEVTASSHSSTCVSRAEG